MSNPSPFRAPPLLLASLALAVAASLALSPVLADTGSELRSARGRLAELRGRIRDQSRTLAGLEREAQALADRISEVQTRIALNRARARRLRVEVERAGRQLRLLQDRLDSRARAAYEGGTGGLVEALLGASSFVQFSDRLEVLARARESDNELIGEIQQRRIRLYRKQAEVRMLRLRLMASRRELAARQDALRSKLRSAGGAYDRLKAALRKGELLVKRLAEKRQREIQRSRLEAARRAAEERQQRAVQPQFSSGGTGGAGQGGEATGPGSSSRASGILSVCPVDPPRAFSDDFGAPRVGHKHQGNDIFAPYGTPVRAPFAGTATDATNDIGGRAVSVYGPLGHVYNAHLSRIGRLGAVSAGSVIGYVGTSGNAAGTAPHDHFEWHPGNGRAVDPYPLLSAVC